MKISVAFALPLLSAAPGLFVPPLPAQQAPRSGISRSMEQAIRLYHEQQDTEAMDRFMDILVKGSPSEKALANEYISKITLRMNTGVNTVKDTGPETGALTEVSAPARTAPAEPARAARPEPRDEEEAEEAARDDAADQRALVGEKINSRIAAMRRDILLELGRGDAVKVYMGDGLPKALTLDPNYFFSTETTFRAGTDKLLGLLSGLLFTLGKANVLILPEGSAEGDVKIRSIRRALALNSYFESRGISKSRLEVNLTGTEVRFPKELTSVAGLVVLFDYEKQPRLKDLEDMQTKGPKVSLGIYPTAIAVHNNEGAIVEFSAFESPAGEPSWKFQIFQVLKDGSRLLLQEMSGSAQQYNQSFWNGRKKFFGAPYPSGKYMFTVTAADVEGRETTLSRLLVIRPTPEEEKAMAAKAPAQRSAERVSPAGVKTRSLTKGVKGGAAGKLMKAGKGKGGKTAPARKARPAPKKKAVVPPAEEEAAPAEEAPAKGSAAPPGQLSGQVNYKIFFQSNTSNSLTSTSEKRLAQVADTMNYYPMATAQLTGYAHSGEANADAVAENRVNLVASRLEEQYKIDRSRLDLKSKVSETTNPMVVVKLAGNE